MTFRLALLASPLAWGLLGLIRLWPRLGQPETWTSGDDWLTYRQTMERILDGHLLGRDGATGVSTLTYPYVLAAFALVGGSAPANLYWAQHTVIGAACALLALLGSRLWGARAGWLTLAAVTLYAGLDVARHYAITLLPESVALLAVALLFLALHWYLTAPSIPTALLAGVALGFAVLTRFALLPFAGLVLAWVVTRRESRC